MHAFQILYTSEAINDSHCVINCIHYIHLYSHNLIIRLVIKWSSFFAINAAKRRSNPLQDVSKSRYERVIQSCWRSPNEGRWTARTRGGGGEEKETCGRSWNGKTRSSATMRTRTLCAIYIYIYIYIYIIYSVRTSQRTQCTFTTKTSRRMLYIETTLA